MNPAWDPTIAAASKSITYRWAVDIAKGSLADRDFRTVDEWAKYAGTSRTMISQRCRMLGVRPQRARDLARALFAMIAGHRNGCAAYLMLDISDKRTLDAFRQRATAEFQSATDVGR